MQDEYHKKDPLQFPRTSKSAYFIEPRDLLAAQKKARVSHEELRVIYHSHIDVGAYFSDEDKRAACAEEKPVYPEVLYLVVSVQKGKAGESKLYEWDQSKKQFIERKLKEDRDKRVREGLEKILGVSSSSF